MSYKKKPGSSNQEDIDPSVYLYDEIYEDMKNEETNNDIEEGDKKDESQPTGSKYIEAIKQVAENRKTESEIRKFKKYARDMEQARENTSDEDIYITSSYSKKLAEMRRMETARRSAMQQQEEKLGFNIFKKPRTDNLVPNVQDNDSPGEVRHASKTQSGKDDRLAVDAVVREGTPSDSKISPSEIEPEFIGPARPDRSSGDTKTEVKRKIPKTYEEKKRFLRKILAKRTIGKVYEAAVKRYEARSKVIAQGMTES